MEQRDFREMMEKMKKNATFAAGEVFYDETGKVVKEVLQHSDNIDYEEAKKMQGMAQDLHKMVTEMTSDNAPPEEIAKEVGKVVKKHKRF